MGRLGPPPGRNSPVLRLSCVAVLAALPLLPQEQPASFSVDVRLVNVLATVKDQQGAPTGDLERENFSVLAGGVAQEIAVFERQTDRPLSVALLFDASPSVGKELKFEQDAAIKFIRSLLGSGANPADQIAVYKFSDFVDEVQDFTGSVPRLERAIPNMRIHGGTSLYDALYLAAQRLERRHGRKVIVVITDGDDTTSDIKFNEALRAVQLADTVVYSVVVVPITNDAGRNLGGENALKTLSAASGGRAFMQHSAQDLDGIFRQIERELRLQYLIGFYPRSVPESSNRFHRIELRVDQPGLQVLARTGYFSGPEMERPATYSPNVSTDGAPARERKKTVPSETGPKRSSRSIP